MSWTQHNINIKNEQGVKMGLGEERPDCLSSDPVAVFQNLLYISVSKNISIYLSIYFDMM